MKYKPYSDYDIHLLFSEVREISDQPYMLHAAYLLSCLFETYNPDDDEEVDLEHTWGWKIPINILKSIIKNANEQFVYSAQNSLQIDIWDKGYSIRKANTCDFSRLHNIFDFITDNDDYIVSKDGIMNLAIQSTHDALEEYKKEYSDNKAYLRKVIMIAEDDAHNGWNKLTDIETTLYLWAIFYRKYKKDDATLFRKTFKNDFYTTAEDDKQCWNQAAKMLDKPQGLYAFSANEIRRWNKLHNQKSIVDSANEELANDYWYNVAINTSCK